MDGIFSFLENFKLKMGLINWAIIIGNLGVYMYIYSTRYTEYYSKYKLYFITPIICKKINKQKHFSNTHSDKRLKLLGYTLCFQMLVTFFRWTIACTQPTLQKQVDILSQNVTKTWKHTVNKIYKKIMVAGLVRCLEFV